MTSTAWRAQIYRMLTGNKHLIPFTGADRYNYNFIISGKSKDGTPQFETYAAMQAVSEEWLPAEAVVRLTDDTAKVKFVRRLLSESKKMMLKKMIILMNRELGSVEVMCFLDGHGKKFPMAVFCRLQSRIPIILHSLLPIHRSNPLTASAFHK